MKRLIIRWYFAMYKICFQIIVGIVLVGFSSPALAQTMSVHDYHRGLRELNREMATLKEQLRQERKARQRLEYQYSQNTGPAGKEPASSAAVDDLARDRDLLLEKVAVLETRSNTRKDLFTNFRLFGTLFVEKLKVTGQDSQSRSAAEPIFFGLSHQFTDTVDFHLLLRKGSYTGSSALAIQNAYVDTRLHGDWSILAGRFDLPLSAERNGTDPRNYHSVVPALYQRALAPKGLTGDGVGLRFYQERGFRGGLYLHNGLDGDLLNSQTGLLAAAATEGKSFEKLGLTARLDYQTDTTLAAGLTAMYSGLARSANSFSPVKSPAGASITGILADAEVKIIGLELALGVAHYAIAESAELNASYGGTIGSEMSGFFVQGAFNLFSLGLETTDELTMFLRYDQVNTQEGTEGFARSAENLRKQTTIGFNYDVTKSVMLKADHTILNDDSRATDDGSATRIGIGLSF